MNRLGYQLKLKLEREGERERERRNLPAGLSLIFFHNVHPKHERSTNHGSIVNDNVVEEPSSMAEKIARRRLRGLILPQETMLRLDVLSNVVHIS